MFIHFFGILALTILWTVDQQNTQRSTEFSDTSMSAYSVLRVLQTLGQLFISLYWIFIHVRSLGFVHVPIIRRMFSAGLGFIVVEGIVALFHLGSSTTSIDTVFTADIVFFTIWPLASVIIERRQERNRRKLLTLRENLVHSHDLTLPFIRMLYKNYCEKDKPLQAAELILQVTTHRRWCNIPTCLCRILLLEIPVSYESDITASVILNLEAKKKTSVPTSHTNKHKNALVTEESVLLCPSMYLAAYSVEVALNRNTENQDRIREKLINPQIADLMTKHVKQGIDIRKGVNKEILFLGSEQRMDMFIWSLYAYPLASRGSCYLT